MERRSDFRLIMPLIFRAMGVAMGIGAVGLNLVKAAPLETQVLLLGFGVSSLAIALLNKEEHDGR